MTGVFPKLRTPNKKLDQCLITPISGEKRNLVSETKHC